MLVSVPPITVIQGMAVSLGALLQPFVLKTGATVAYVAKT
jgi:hypothetical protein